MNWAIIKPVLLAMCSVKIVLCNDSNDKIIIIGAGPAGMEAAIHLYKNGFTNVETLEAESYIGGYIHTVQETAGNGKKEYRELGDQWIIGPALRQSEIADIENNDDLFVTSKSFKGSRRVPFIFSNGTELAEAVGSEAHNFLIEMYEHNKRNEPSDDSNEMLNLSIFVKESLANITGPLTNIQDEINRFFENFILAHGPFGDWDSLSYSSFCRTVEKAHIFNYINSGLSSLFRLSYNHHVDDSLEFLNLSIRLNKAVRQIDYSESVVLIHTDDGETYTADKVIVALPLGALKSSYHTLFKPPLSWEKELAFDNVRVSYHEKALLEFNEEWWPQGFSYYQLWTNQDYSKLIGGREWLSTLLGISVVDDNPKALVAYFKGPNARLLKNVEDNILKTEIVALLRKSFKSKHIPEPAHFLRTNWSGNSRFLGGYSYRSDSSYVEHIAIEHLANPVDNKLYFAGEYMIGRNWGTLVGDMQSGMTAVQQILESYYLV